jgi:hypothetical protein
VTILQMNIPLETSLGTCQYDKIDCKWCLQIAPSICTPVMAHHPLVNPALLNPCVKFTMLSFARNKTERKTHDEKLRLAEKTDDQNK